MLHIDIICKCHLSARSVVCKKATKLFHPTANQFASSTKHQIQISSDRRCDLRSILKKDHTPSFHPHEKPTQALPRSDNRSFHFLTMPNRHSIDEIQAFMSKYDVRFDFPIFQRRDLVRLEYRDKKTRRRYRAFARQRAMQCFEYAGPNEDLDGPLLGESGREVRRVDSWCKGQAAARGTNPFWKEGYQQYWL